MQVGKLRTLVGCLIGAFAMALLAQFLVLDGITGILAPWMFSTHTDYAPGYSDSAFRKIRHGMTVEQVNALIGEPLWESWTYDRRKPLCRVLWFKNGVLTEPKTDTLQQSPECASLSLSTGMTASAVRARAGSPSEIHWIYSESRSGDSYRERIVEFKNESVERTIAQFYVD